jgi:hypothetical protein
MKKIALISALLLFVGLTYGQGIVKGNLIGTHTMTITLKEGVTMDKFVKFFNSKYKPEAEKNIPGCKIYLVKAVRGENPDSYGMIIVFKNAKERDKYFNPDGTSTKLGKGVEEKLKKVTEEMDKLGTYTTKYTDWIVQ